MCLISNFKALMSNIFCYLNITLTRSSSTQDSDKEELQLSESGCLKKRKECESSGYPGVLSHFIHWRWIMVDPSYLVCLLR